MGRRCFYSFHGGSGNYRKPVHHVQWSGQQRVYGVLHRDQQLQLPAFEHRPSQRCVAVSGRIRSIHRHHAVVLPDQYERRGLLESHQSVGYHRAAKCWRWNQRHFPHRQLRRRFIWTWYIFDVSNSPALDLAIQGTTTQVLTATNPPALAPSFSLIAFTNGQFQFTVNGTAGTNYVVQATTNLAAPNWIARDDERRAVLVHGIEFSSTGVLPG